MEKTMMPMNEKGGKIMRDFMGKYGKKGGKSTAYATANKQKSEGKGKLYSLLHGMK
jgi:hypothetical protein